jgi:hypothetical protein
MIAAVRQDGGAIGRILRVFGKETDYDLMMAAVQQDGRAIGQILEVFGKDVDPKLMMAAVQQDGLAIEDIFYAGIKPSKQLIAAALENAGENLDYIKLLLNRQGLL